MIGGIDHVNLVVDDLEKMVAFYERFLDLKVSKRVTIGGDWVEQVVGLPDPLAEVVYLDAAQGPRIELIRYLRPQRPRPSGIDQPHAPGIRHVAFRVEHIDECVRRLEESGIRFFSEVQQVPDSQVTYHGGIRKRLVYFYDPERNLLELCEYRS